MAYDEMDEEKEESFESQVEDGELNPDDAGVMEGFNEEPEDEEDTGDEEYEAAFDEQDEEEEPEEIDEEW